ncbi:protein ITPRID2 [Odontesthes bonariensis]|uniref:protein ITPRID2 n=1 Tax=Odontesthes bonariensis TaxID=219752 RepID=UPI003F588AF0
MESGVLGMESGTAPVKPVSMAHVRRQAWAKSKDSSGQGTQSEHCDPQQSQSNGDNQKVSEEPGQDPNKIDIWLVECRTPLGASLDDQIPSPSKGAVRNGCSFEDDLSLGAEANHLHSTNNKTESCFGLAADQKRSQYKEKGRSMNSTGSGKSSTVSSVSELLDLYEEDPEEILLNLGFGREEPDLSAKIPSRFFNNTSSARGIDIKVYLGAQLQRMELENPNYALTSRFRQIEVLTTVANEFFQLYSQVSGQPVPRISSKELGGEGGGPEEEQKSPTLKRSNSARNVAKLLRKNISKHNLLASESPEAHSPKQQTQLNGQAATPDHAHVNGHAHASPEQDRHSIDSDHQAETFSQKHIRRKDNFSLETVTEETSGDGETDRLTDCSSEQSKTGPERQAESADPPSAKLRTKEEGPEVAKEKNLTSTPAKAASTLAPPQLAQLRTENADSFDMEEIQTNEDEALPHGTSRTTDLSRTVSQQSDSSGFAEEPSVDSNSYLKVQESCDSCDSETTVTSHPSQDVATPHALDQPAFDLPDGRQEEVGPTGVTRRGSSGEEDELKESSEQVPQYRAHHLPKLSPAGVHQDEARDGEQVNDGNGTDPDTEPQPDSPQSMSASGQEPQLDLQHTQNQSEHEPQQNEHLTTTNTDHKEGAEPHIEPVFLDDSSSVYPPPPCSPVLSALSRAKRNQLSRAGQHINPQSKDALQTPGGGRGRRGVIPLQRSSSLPSSLLSPRVVSSIRVQFGQGQASCTQPRYSFKYTQEDAAHKEEEETLEEKEEDGGQRNCLSTLIINPGSKENPPAAIPPKPIPHHLMRSSYSLQSSSPPPDWSPAYNPFSWSTQSVPDLSSTQQHPRQFPQSTHANQKRLNWNPGQMMLPNPSPSALFSDPSPNPSLGSNSSPYPFSLNPHPCHSYVSPPNHRNTSLNHYSSLTSLHHPPTPPVPPHGSLANLHQPPPSTSPHSHRGTPTMHHHSYNHPYSHQPPYYTSPQFASPYQVYHGYNMSPHFVLPHPATQYLPMAPEHGFHPGLAHSSPGFPASMGSSPNPSQNSYLGLTPPAAPGSGPGHIPSSTEMQLRRVLHEIRGTVQSLSQNQDGTPDAFGDHRAAAPTHQSLAECQQKRRNLNMFRNQMVNLELSIMRQQAVVYKHLSPADRLEAEQLQSLRSAVREELQELEQQLEDRLIELTQHSQHRGLHRGSSVDSLSTASALRAMEPMSDLLREQFFLQSELSYDSRGPSTNPSTRSSSPVRSEGDAKQRQGVYRASINITPAPPPRPNTLTEEGEEKERQRDSKREEVGIVGEGFGEEDTLEEERAAGRFKAENFQQLIREIRESVAKEVKREIYSELLAAASPRGSPLPARQHPL